MESCSWPLRSDAEGSPHSSCVNYRPLPSWLVCPGLCAAPTPGRGSGPLGPLMWLCRWGCTSVTLLAPSPGPSFTVHGSDCMRSQGQGPLPHADAGLSHPWELRVESGEEDVGEDQWARKKALGPGLQGQRSQVAGAGGLAPALPGACPLSCAPWRPEKGPWAVRAISPPSGVRP